MPNGQNMSNILFITSSPRGDASHSAQVAKEFVDQLEAAHPGSQVVHRDLRLTPPPALNESIVGAYFTPADSRTAEQRELLSVSDALIAELQAADILVIASGMINFGVSATLKAWIDLVLRAGITFRYGADGPEGLLLGKKAYLVLASGGVYSEGPAAALDHQAPYLHAVLSFIGIKDITTVRIEGVAYGPDAAQLAISAAKEELAALANAN